MQRLARAEGTTPAALCERLAGELGLRIATIDTILWRACAIGLLDSAAIEEAALGPRGPKGARAVRRRRKA